MKRSVEAYQNPNANAGEYSEPPIPSRSVKPKLKPRQRRRERDSLSFN
jgi:hypothetical protein